MTVLWRSISEVGWTLRVALHRGHWLKHLWYLDVCVTVDILLCRALHAYVISINHLFTTTKSPCAADRLIMVVRVLLWADYSIMLIVYTQSKLVIIDILLTRRPEDIWHGMLLHTTGLLSYWWRVLFLSCRVLLWFVNGTLKADISKSTRLFISNHDIYSLLMHQLLNTAHFLIEISVPCLRPWTLTKAILWISIIRGSSASYDKSLFQFHLWPTLSHIYATIFTFFGVFSLARWVFTLTWEYRIIHSE